MGSYKEKEAIPLKREESTFSSSGVWRKKRATWEMTVTRKKNKRKNARKKALKDSDPGRFSIFGG